MPVETILERSTETSIVLSDVVIRLHNGFIALMVLDCCYCDVWVVVGVRGDVILAVAVMAC